MRILIVGTGYVGLVTGACFAKNGHKVICLDINKEKIATLSQGKIPIYEPGLQELVAECLHKKTLEFTSDYASIDGCSTVFITVPTPSTEGGKADLSYLEQAVLQAITHANGPKLFVIKSTVPPGTFYHIKDLIQKTLQEQKKSFSIDLVSNPEFLREGSAVYDCLRPDRVILGYESTTLIPILQKLYDPFDLPQDALILMDPTSAEMTKYAANAMLATRISFMNELAGLCEKLHANIEQVRIGIGSDKRIGPQFLHAGVGFGGSCFPKDIRALKAVAENVAYPTPILNAVEAINHKQKKLLGEKISRYFASRGGIQGKTIAIWGLAFKPNTDDIREAPSLELIEELRQAGARLRLFDPVAMENTKCLFQQQRDLFFCLDEYEAGTGADAIALLTEWPQFRSTNLEQVLTSMKGQALFDGRN
ncbi:MAG: UDP-glucose/GDP-mannose dehydrogenase family protein, partial [Chlamydiae bacterium]|nr:UDP-glucose/GDP-mannose dehydrogenase family protein [Chlamydiota bacterium]